MKADCAPSSQEVLSIDPVFNVPTFDICSGRLRRHLTSLPNPLAAATPTGNGVQAESHAAAAYLHAEVAGKCVDFHKSFIVKRFN